VLELDVDAVGEALLRAAELRARLRNATLLHCLELATFGVRWTDEELARWHGRGFHGGAREVQARQVARELHMLAAFRFVEAWEVFQPGVVPGPIVMDWPPHLSRRELALDFVSQYQRESAPDQERDVWELLGAAAWGRSSYEERQLALPLNVATPASRTDLATRIVDTAAQLEACDRRHARRKGTHG
jgi:hypothetical protein